MMGLNSCFAAFVASGFSWGKFWMRGNILSNMFAVGSTVNFDKQQISSEAAYDLSGKEKGVGGLPLFVRLGHQIKWQNDFVYTSRVNLGRNWVMSNVVEIPVDSNLKIQYHDYMNFKQWW